MIMYALALCLTVSAGNLDAGPVFHCFKYSDTIRFHTAFDCEVKRTTMNIYFSALPPLTTYDIGFMCIRDDPMPEDLK